MRVLLTIGLLMCSNVFMTWAWYGHLKRPGWPLAVAIGASWLLAFPEYLLQVPANRFGHAAFGGPFTVSQLKVLNEAITICVFICFAVLMLHERPRWNEYVAFALIFAGVAVAMLGRPDPGIQAFAGAPAAHELTVLYFDGCPNTPPVIEAAEQAAALLGSDWSVSTIDLEALPDDDLRRGYGSPTVLVSGRDLFGAPAPTSATLSCRHYAAGVPDAHAIVAAVRADDTP